MKTTLPAKINSLLEAEMFLEELYINDESFHPEDDAFQIEWACSPPPSITEMARLNELMFDIYALPERINGSFDPCEFLLRLENNYMFAIYMTNSGTELDQLKADTCKAGTLSAMHYHDEWECLMPVLEKISTNCTVHMEMAGECRCTIKQFSYSGGRQQIWAAENTAPTMLPAAYYSALELITLKIIKQ